MKQVLLVFGTRPEAIKMAPVVQALETSQKLRPVTCVTAQHRSLLDQVLKFFGVKPDIDLNLMRPNQSLFDITIQGLDQIRKVCAEVKPDVVLVQGDTTTTFAAALAAFYCRVPVGHIEAGLRTWNKYSPYPEEANRCMVSQLTDFHFAPTDQAVMNLRGENALERKVWLTGNTSVDAFLWAQERATHYPHLKQLYGDRKLVLLTAHRRENFGAPFEEIFDAILEFSRTQKEIHIVYPVHPNPNVSGVAQRVLGAQSNISLIPPVEYDELVYLLKNCSFVLTDSGGIQEEAPTLGKPVLVLRDTTERPEAVSAGCAKLVGHSREEILFHAKNLSDENSTLYREMSQAANPFGNGTAAAQIVSILERELVR